MSLSRLLERAIALREEAMDEPSQELFDILEGLIAEIGRIEEDIDGILKVLGELIDGMLENTEVEVRIR